MNVPRYRKAIIAFIPAVIAFLSAIGVVFPDEIQSSATTVINSVAAILVLLIPNEQ